MKTRALAGPGLLELLPEARKGGVNPDRLHRTLMEHLVKLCEEVFRSATESARSTIASGIDELHCFRPWKPSRLNRGDTAPVLCHPESLLIREADHE